MFFVLKNKEKMYEIKHIQFEYPIYPQNTLKYGFRQKKLPLYLF